MNDLTLARHLNAEITPQPSPGSPAPAAQHVLHLAVNLKDAAFRFLAPASQALAEVGHQQTILIFDDPLHTDRITQFHDSVNVHALPITKSPLRDWQLYTERATELARQHRVTGVHVHGVLPWVMGSRFGRALPRGVALYFSPHSSRALTAIPPLRWLVRQMIGSPQPDRHAAVILSDPDATRQMLDSGIPAAPVGQTVVPQYFAAPRKESGRPLVISGLEQADRRSVETFSRLAVLLSSSELGLSFNWVGEADAASAARLTAANVGLFKSTRDADVVARLGSGWVWLSASHRGGFPTMLARAMAAGLPCLATDVPAHRNLIRHGVTGMLYQTDEQALSLLSQLLDNEALRTELGVAARQEAMLRFSPQRFSSALLSAYGTTPAAAPPPLDEPPASRSAA